MQEAKRQVKTRKSRGGGLSRRRRAGRLHHVAWASRPCCIGSPVVSEASGMPMPRRFPRPLPSAKAATPITVHNTTYDARMSWVAAFHEVKGWLDPALASGKGRHPHYSTQYDIRCTNELGGSLSRSEGLVGSGPCLRQRPPPPLRRWASVIVLHSAVCI